MISNLNKKRKQICTLSYILTLVIIVISAILIFFFLKNILIILLSTCILLFGLYGLSKFVIMPKYEKIKQCIISENLKKLNSNLNISFINSFSSLLEKYFIKDNLKYHNSLKLSGSNEYLIQDFVYTEKVAKKIKEKITFKGKVLITKNNNYFSKDFVAIYANTSDSKYFENKTSEIFKNCNLKSVNIAGNKYLTNCKEKKEIELISNYFMFTNNFHLLINYKGEITIIIKEKTQPFEFKLQTEIDDNTFKECKDNYSEIYKLLKIFEVNSNAQ